MSNSGSDNEVQQDQQDQHSIWNGRLKTNPKEAKFFLEFLDALSKEFDVPNDEIMNYFFGEPRDVLEKSIRKANKREKKDKAKFTPKDLKKPATANILFQKYFKAECNKTGTKFDLKTCSTAYKALSDKERAKYIAEAQRLKEEYAIAYEQQKVEAINSGDFPADKPKKPLSAYFRYLNYIRPQLQDKYADTEDRKLANSLIIKDAGEMWKALTDKQKEKYEAAYQKDKEQYKIEIAKWEDNETRRLKGNDVVSIVSSGSKKVEPAPASASASASAISDSEEEEVKQKLTRNSAKPVETKPVVVESEQENDDTPEPPKKTKEPAKKMGKAKNSKSTSQ